MVNRVCRASSWDILPFEKIIFQDELQEYMQCWPLLKTLLSCKFPGEVVLVTNVRNPDGHVGVEINVRVKISRQLRRLIPALCALCGNNKASRLTDATDAYYGGWRWRPSTDEMRNILEAPSSQSADRRRLRFRF